MVQNGSHVQIGRFGEGADILYQDMLEPHDSKPYNPDIANVFYRAGYIEYWGRGIQKICDACKELGAELPRYELIGRGLRVHFKALESALIDPPKAPNRQNVGKDVGLDGGLAESDLGVGE